MIIQNIGARALSMYIGSDELNELGLTPDGVGRQEATQLLKEALDENAMGQWDAAELELYPGKDSLLLFVRRKSATPYYFIFDSIDAVISACLLCPARMPSSLAHMGKEYLLTVYPFEGDAPPPILYEFGENRSMSLCHFLHFTEQGTFIMKEKAIETFQKHFA